MTVLESYHLRLQFVIMAVQLLLIRVLGTLVNKMMGLMLLCSSKIDGWVKYLLQACLRMSIYMCI